MANYNVPLNNSISTATLSQDVFSFGDQSVPMVENNGVNMLGGVTNLQETYTANDGSEQIYTENNQKIIVTDNGDGTSGVYVDGVLRVTISSYGIGKKININNSNDILLTDDDTYMTLSLNGALIVVTEFDLDGNQLNTKSTSFTGLADIMNMFISISFVRARSIHFSDVLEFGMRLGDQIVIISESNPNINIVTAIQTTTVLGTGNTINTSCLWGGYIVFAGTGGKVGSFDGVNWKNADGSGIGSGPYNDGSAMGSNTINASYNYGLNGEIVFAGDGGRVCSYSASGWRYYNGTGALVGFYDNSTLIGTNNITAIAIELTGDEPLIIFAGYGGRVGCASATTKYPYTTSVSAYDPNRRYTLPCNTGAITGGAAILALNSTPDGLYAGGGLGRIATYNRGWRQYDGASSPPTSSTINVGAYVTTAAPGGAWKDIAYGNGAWVAVAQSTSTTTSIARSTNNGVTWSFITIPSAPASSLSKITTNGAGTFVAIANSTSTTASILTSTDNGVTWAFKTLPSTPAGPLVSITYGSAGFAISTTSASATLGIIKSTDGLTWTYITGIPTTGTFSAIGYMNGYYYLSNGNYTSTTAQVYRSSTLSNSSFTAVTVPSFSLANSVIGFAYGNNTYVMCSSSPTVTPHVSYSTNGTTFTSVTLPSTPGSSIVDIVFINGVFVLITLSTAANTSMYTSTDGITWTAKTLSSAPTFGFNAVAGNDVNGQVIVVANNTTTNAGIYITVPLNLSSNVDNATIVGSDNITAMGNYSSATIIGSSLGNLGNITALTKRTYTGSGAGLNVYNNATVIGSSAIYSITIFGTLLVVAGGSSNLGSFDGANWKNFDGSGTGTGIYSPDILIGESIRTTNVYNNLLYAGGGASSVNTITSSNEYTQFYSDGSSPVAIGSLLYGITSNSYPMLYKMKANQYLIFLAGNEVNKYFIVNPSTLIATSAKGTWIAMETLSNETYGIITETPYFDVTNLYCFSGFFNTSTSTASPTSIPIAIDTSLIEFGQIGYGYGDVIFKTTSGGNLLNEMYGPVPSKFAGTGTLYKVYFSGTNTPVSGYSKINNLGNLFGKNITPKFDFRINMIPSSNNNAEQSYISVAACDSIGADTLGTLITPVGGFDPSYQYQIKDGFKIAYKNDSGSFTIIKISDTVENRVQSIDGKLYKINTISPLNIWDSVNSKMNLGSMDYNGRSFFTSTALPGTSTKVASIISTDNSSSVDTGDKLVQITGIDSSNIEVFGQRIPFVSFENSMKVETYINDIYSFSTTFGGAEFVDTSLIDTIYVTDTKIPLPIGSIYSDGTAFDGISTAFLKTNFDGYEIGNDAKGAYVPFSLYGQTYIYDQRDIYLSSFTNGLLTGLDKICSAQGMKYIATTPAQAYFLSSFDNSLYAFQGSRSLVKAMSFVTLDTINYGSWSTIDNSLMLDTDSKIIWMRDGIITAQSKTAAQVGISAYSTNAGIILANPSGSWRYTYYPQSGSTPIQLSMQTGYVGQLYSEKSILKEWVVTLYSEDKVDTTIYATEFCKDQDAQYENTTVFNLSAKDFDKKGYAWIRVLPKYQRALGSSLKIVCNTKIVVLEVSVAYDDAGKAIIASNKTR